MKFHQIVSIVALLFVSNVNAYSTQSSSPSQNQHPMNRITFLQKAGVAITGGAATLMSNVEPVRAKEIDAALKGTKNDPEYQACLSKCVFDCTKPKGSEQRSRAECLPECKQKCATSKEQLMIGTPIQK